MNTLLEAKEKDTDIFIIDAKGLLLHYQIGNYSEKALSVEKNKINDALKKLQ